MARPRSILGLLGALLAIHVRRRPLLALAAVTALAALGLVAVAAWRLCGEEAPSSPARPLQTAVLPDGFAILEGPAHDRRVILTDRDGQRRGEIGVLLTAPETRLVGTARGPGLGWLEGTKIKLATVGADGKLAISTWGKSVRRICDGVASNEHRFGVAWHDSDDKIWFVHGPVTGTAMASEPVEAAELMSATGVDWCAIASAHDHVALFWRDGQRTYMNLCSKKSCSGLTSRVPLDPADEVLGIGCVRDGCAFALRTPAGVHKLGWANPRGKVLWAKPLPAAVRDTEVAIIGAGDRGIVVAYVASEGATAIRVLSSGSSSRVWADPAATETPSIAWANDHLLVAHHHGDALAPEVVAVPR